jgi:hypothetical protein
MAWNRSRYPGNWPEVSKRIREIRAGLRCECRGECGRDHGGRCPARKGDLSENRRGTIFLTCAHLWRSVCRCALENEGDLCANPDHLKAMCNGCHLRYDVPLHRRNARDTIDRKRGQLRFPFF